MVPPILYPEELKTAELFTEIFIKAVKQDGMAIRHFPDEIKTEELCFEAVMQDGRALRHIPKNVKTEGFCLKAVKQNWKLYKYVPENLRTPELMEEVIYRKEFFGL